MCVSFLCRRAALGKDRPNNYQKKSFFGNSGYDDASFHARILGAALVFRCLIGHKNYTTKISIM